MIASDFTGKPVEFPKPPNYPGQVSPMSTIGNHMRTTAVFTGNCLPLAKEAERTEALVTESKSKERQPPASHFAHTETIDASAARIVRVHLSRDILTGLNKIQKHCGTP